MPIGPNLPLVAGKKCCLKMPLPQFNNTAILLAKIQAIAPLLLMQWISYILEKWMAFVLYRAIAILQDWQQD